MTGRKSETREEGLGTREGGAGERKREGRLHFRSISFAVVALFLSLLFSLFSSPLFLSFSLLSSLLFSSLPFFSFLCRHFPKRRDTPLPTNFTRPDLSIRALANAFSFVSFARREIDSCARLARCYVRGEAKDRLRSAIGGRLKISRGREDWKFGRETCLRIASNRDLRERRRNTVRDKVKVSLLGCGA